MMDSQDPSRHLILSDPSRPSPCNPSSLAGCSTSILISPALNESLSPLNLRPPDTSHRRQIPLSFHPPGRARAFSSLSANSFAVANVRSGQQHLDIKMSPGGDRSLPPHLNQYQHPIGFKHSSRALSDDEVRSHHLYQCQVAQLEESRAKIEELEKQLSLVVDSHRLVEQTTVDLHNENLVMRGVNYGLARFVDGNKEQDNKDKIELIEKRVIQLENKLNVLNENKIAQLEAEIEDLKNKTCDDNARYPSGCNKNFDQVADEKSQLDLQISKQSEKINYILKQATFLSKQVDSTHESVTFALQQINHNKMTINEDSERIDFVVRFLADVLWSEESEEREQLDSYTGLISPLLETSDEGESDNFDVEVDRNGNSETEQCRARSTRKSHNICGYFPSNHNLNLKSVPSNNFHDTIDTSTSFMESIHEEYDDVEEDMFENYDVSIVTPQLQSRAAIQEFLHTGHIADTPAPGQFAARMKTGRPMGSKGEQSLADELAGFM